MLFHRRTLLKRALCLTGSVLGLPRVMRAAALDRHPYLQNVGTSHASVLWTTLERAEPSLVQYSTDFSFSTFATQLASSREFPAALTGMGFTYYQHQADLRGLDPGTRYYYRVFADRQNLLPVSPEEELTFRTALDRADFRFLAIGDSGTGMADQQALALRMDRETASLLIHTGDVVYPDGTFQNYRDKWFRIYRSMMQRMPFYPSIGNHDVLADRGFSYVAVHSFPPNGLGEAERGRYYSFDWGEVHFISLDSESLVDPVRRETMLAWLEQDLQRAEARPWKIAFWHHTPHDAARGRDPEATLARERIVPILEAHGVQAVFCGHSHLYLRTKPAWQGRAVAPGRGIVYVTTGGGGGGLHDLPDPPHPLTEVAHKAHHYVTADVHSGSLLIRAVGVNGEVLDSFGISPNPVVSPGAVVNGASYMPEVAPGSVVSIFGRFLAHELAHASAYPLPTDLAGVSVTYNGVKLPLYFVSARQINAQLPFDAQGEGVFKVTTPSGSSEARMGILPSAPGIFVVGANSPAVVKADYSVVSDNNPIRPGDSIVIYLTGLGRVSGTISAGIAAPAAPLMRAASQVQVHIDNETVTPFFAGLAPGYAGLYQVNVQAPAGIEAGRRNLRVSASGKLSNTVRLAVAAR